LLNNLVLNKRMHSDNHKDSILIADDDELNRELLSHRLSTEGYVIETAENGKKAWDLLQQQTFSLALLDINMPEMDGIQVLENIKQHPSLNSLPVVMVTALDDVSSSVKCISMGADDYITKPFDPILLKARIKSSLDKKRYYDENERFRHALQQENKELEMTVQEKITELSSAQLAAIFAMSKLAESKDNETGAHLDRLREYCKVLAEDLAATDKYRNVIDQTYIDTIYAASPLHDVGKVGIPDNVLLKPGKLDQNEWQIMQTHTTIGAETLRAVLKQHANNNFIQMGIDIALSHHEKWDGSGYPEGLLRTGIPLSARILALGDVYDALTSKRCYKEAFSHEKSREIILEGVESHFDPDVVEAFLRVEKVFYHTRKQYQDEDS